MTTRERINRSQRTKSVVARPVEETLVTDPRGDMSPAQYVEGRLLSLLKSNPALVSHSRLCARILNDHGR